MSKLKFNPNDFEPKRFGLRYNPPQIVLEYLAPSSSKLYHHKIKLPKLKHDSNLEELMKEINEKHSQYFVEGKVSQTQILKLVEKLRSNLKPNKCFLKSEKLENLVIETKPGKSKSKDILI